MVVQNSSLQKQGLAGQKTTNVQADSKVAPKGTAQIEWLHGVGQPQSRHIVIFLANALDSNEMR